MQKQSPTKNKVLHHKKHPPSTPAQQPHDKKYPDYVLLTSSLLRDLIEDEQQEQTSQTTFDSSLLKDIDLKVYIDSIHKETRFEPECLILALIYIDRYNLNSGDFTLTWLNIHKLLLASLVLATKFHDQVYYDNKAFQIGGGVNNVKLIELEMKVFQILEFNLFVDDAYFFEFLDSLYNAYMPQDTANDDKSENESQEETQN